MRKILLSTTSLVFGAALALSVAGSASAGEIGDTIEQAAKDSKVALDWLEGKLDNYGKNPVSYDGPPITLTSTSHVPAISSLAKLQIKAWKNLERMSKGKIKVNASWSASVHSVREGRKAARTGLTDQAPCFSLYSARDYNMVGGLGLPFLFNNSHEAVATAEHLYPKYLKKPDEVYRGLVPACERSRLELRTRWPRRSKCASPQAPVDAAATRAGPPELVVTFVRGRRHLPIVSLRRAA